VRQNEEIDVGHIVVFEGSERVPTFHRCEELADAVSFVEKLRNDRGVEKVQIYRTEEVRFDFKPYYRVELGALGAGSTPTPLAAAPSASMAPPPPISAIPSPSEPSTSIGPSPSDPGGYSDDDDELSVGTGVRRGLFGR
jgi:hypothetical protein